jgi:hypothetical protein
MSLVLVSLNMWPVIVPGMMLLVVRMRLIVMLRLMVRLPMMAIMLFMVLRGVVGLAVVASIVLGRLANRKNVSYRWTVFTLNEVLDDFRHFFGWLVCSRGLG